jgi:glycerol-3-phosphate dehydrogenase
VHLADVVLRRTAIAFTGQARTEVLEEIASALAPLLGWDDARRAAELDATRTLLAERHGVAFADATT